MSTQEQGYFTEENSADVVISRNANAKDARLAEVMGAITRQLMRLPYRNIVQFFRSLHVLQKCQHLDDLAGILCG